MTNKHAPHHPPKKSAREAKPASDSSKPASGPLAWSYPFSPTAKADAATDATSPANATDATDPMTYMKALANAEDGFYPLGASGIWHGGIHFGQKTAESLKQDEGVHAIATGEVVAYRLDKKYPELNYQDKRRALYSTGFVLVRHTLTLPPAPKKQDPAPTPSNGAPASPASTSPNGASAPAGASGANGTPPASAAPAPAPASAPSSPPPDETLTFFSLYMHTLDWESYKAALDKAKAPGADPKAPKLTPPAYWQADRTYKALKPNQQDVPKPKSDDPDKLGGQGSAEQCDANTPLPGPVSGVRVRITPGKGKILGLLPEGTELAVNESDNGGVHGWVKITKIIAGTPVGPMMGQQPDQQLPWGYVFKSELEAIPQPGPLDQVVVLRQPFHVNAGDVIAHIGQYQRYREAKLSPPQPSRPLLHLEVFAGPDLPAFITKSQARAKELPDTDSDKPFLEILTGAKLVTKIPDPDYTLEQANLKLVPVSDPKSRWVKVQPKTVTIPAAQPAPAVPSGKGKKSNAKPPSKPDPIETPTGNPFWVENSLVNKTTTVPVKGWKNFPLKVSLADGPGTDFRDVFRVADLNKKAPQDVAREDKDANGKVKRWWNVTVGTKDGKSLQGWVREKDHPKVNLCSPWDWPGFELVDNSSVTMADMSKRYLFVAGLAMEEDQADFKPSADKLAATDLIQKLEKAIDVNHDGTVTATELADAQRTPWLAEAISHMVVKCESEWGGNMGQWEAITPLMKAVPWKWQNEMERIKKLQWWEDVQCADVKILPKDPKPWHFHPIGLIGNFVQSGGECDCGCCMTVTGTRFMHTKTDPWYGPQHSGKISLGSCPALATMRAKGTLGDVEEKILRAMSQNEGCVDTVQAIDAAIISAGAMQKTIRGDASGGELAVQIAVFRDMQPDAYQQYFANCGWTVTGSGGDAQLGYAHPTFTNGVRLIGPELYKALRRDCSKDTMGKPVKCPPVASMAHGVSSPLYQELQIKDFVDRLNQAINKYPNGYSYRIRDYLQSPLGRATVLDQDVNWPGQTSDSMRGSLDRFFSHNPQVSRNPADWGANRGSYEASILQDYGPTRAMAKVNGVSVAPGRYQHLVQALGMPS
ncbi:lytic transglycosylase domain-containing protein [Burkholderia metallica]|uniref:Lytic transglycosylase domain-containing protein n=1 Tax=Burkholderia metallica TaxID=488729 RepID=A0ABT8P907_9BURK|nr:lytic transglycosylase domain-containing protein [Burkholderia metallica]MDN7931446.1 lytic transglycosylase domain-containing protein [Burkholderia metallica]